MDDLPTESGIYYLYENNKLLYVGKSLNIKRRIRQHKLNTFQIIDMAFHRINKIEFVLMDESSISEFEKNEIKRLRPVLNHETYGNDMIFDLINEQEEIMFQKVKDTI